MKLLTLDINFVGTRKKIKRKIQITDDYNLNCLHIAIQELFYFNYDLEHEFEFNNVVYLPEAEHDFANLVEMQKVLQEEMDKLISKEVDIDQLFNTDKTYQDDCTTKLHQLKLSVGDSIEYTYDKDNNYEFTIELVQTNPASKSKIAIVDLKGKFIPQGLDVETYNNLKELKSGEAYEQLVELEKSFDKKLLKQNVESLIPTTTLYDEAN
ncbi:hypothetical protein RZE82_08085 [Mollicutes bacterium LVI A0039]|nr:hypothetical protein RZE82_08085 [Mollicutes bacterium LVI A0039]